MNEKKNNHVSLRIIEAKRKGNRITAKRVKIGILNEILILVPKGFLFERSKLSAPRYATQSSKFPDY